MLTGYFDESYSHPPKPEVYTVAGYVSEDRKWKKFDKQWRQALGDEGVDFFHMKDFAHQKKAFKDWPAEKRKQYLGRLHGIIHRHVIADFAVSVVVADYDEVITPNIRAGFGEPHVFAAIGCMKLIALWAKRINLREHMLYVFEKGTIHDKTVRRVFGAFDDTHSEHYRASGCAFFDKRDLLPLQAADILAYENMLEMRRRIDPDNTRDRRGSIKNLERRGSEWIYYDKAQLLKVLDSGRALGLLE